MKKICVLLFVLSVIVSACSAKGTMIQSDSLRCPEWATERLGNHCESASLSITPSETIGLIDWEIGEIQLNDAYIGNDFGVCFYTLDGQIVRPTDMEDGVFYFFEKTEDTGGFRIYPSDNHTPLSASTHLLLAKSIE